MFSTRPQSPTLDRSIEFPGSSSNTSNLIPSFQHSVPTQPYETGKKYDPPYFRNYNGYWHHGYWGGGQWGWGRWGGPSGIWSVARWWLGPLYFTSGYATFRNPFAVEQKPPALACLNYSKPLENIEDDAVPSSSTAAAEQPDRAPPADGAESQAEIRNYLVRTPEVKAGLKSFDAASDAFQTARYDEALRHIDAALTQLPYDPALHEFRGLVLFALEDYQAAAATIYSVLSVSPGWDWTTLSGRYAQPADFAQQLRKLEAHHKQHPESAAAAFLRAYYYTTCRNNEAAVKQFETVVKMLPDDRLLPQLLSLVKGSLEPVAAPAEGAAGQTASTSTPDANSDPDPATSVPFVDTLVGDWRAQRDDATIVQLQLKKNQQFVWTAMRSAGTARVIAGQFAVEGETLFLAGGSGTLVGRLQSQPGGSFVFSLLGNGGSEMGLLFRRISGR
jgi:tetratricopeptide (TPR) repeat protein